MLTTDLNKKSSAPYEAEAIDLGADLYDHICDHRHDRSTWRQDATRAQKVIFTVAEMSEKRYNVQKNVQVALGVVEAASSSLVTQTKIGGSIEPPIFFYFLAKSLEISRFLDIHNGLVLPYFEG